MLPLKPRALLTVLSLSCAVGLSSGCDSTCRPERDTNLVYNGSFEIGGKPSLDGWTVANPTLSQLVRGGAPGSGSWSLALTADGAPTTTIVWQKIENVASGDLLDVSAYLKAHEGGGGRLRVLIGPSPTDYFGYWDTFSISSGWTKLTLTCQLPRSLEDPVWVVLSSLHTEIVPRTGQFDDVRVVISEE